MFTDSSVTFCYGECEFSSECGAGSACIGSDDYFWCRPRCHSTCRNCVKKFGFDDELNYVKKWEYCDDRVELVNPPSSATGGTSGSGGSPAVSLKENGEACVENDECESSHCADQVCACHPDECPLDPCADVECGSVDGQDCGSCASLEYCSEAGECLDACGDAECGMQNGVNCGGCPARHQCNSSGVCQNVCGNAECGVRSGVSCGVCPGTDYCDAGQCHLACDGRECGEDHGFICGPVCGDGFLCSDAGLCEVPVCSLDNEFTCQNDDVYRCVKGGLENVLYQDCSAESYCKPGRSTCVSNQCWPGALYCYRETYAICDSTGMAPEPGGRDCAAEGLVCGAVGCATAYTEEGIMPGLDWTCGSATVMGNIIEVEEDRTLVSVTQKIELKVGTSASVEWFVLEADSMDGPWASLLALDQTENSPFIKSPTLNVPLAAGKFYGIGVRSSDPDVRLCAGNGALRELSFGVHEGSVFADYRDINQVRTERASAGTTEQTLVTAELQ